MQARLIRFRDAPDYLGMCKNYFNTKVRPLLSEYSIGKRGIAFDRLDLDAWAEHYMARCNERPDAKRSETWDANERQASSKGGAYGMSTSKYSDKEFEKARARALSPKRKAI